MVTPEYNALHIIHVLAVVGLVSAIFVACTGAPETRRKVMIWGGVASLLLLLTGIRMWQSLYNFSGVWAIVKLVCWLGLSALSGIAYRRREKARPLIITTLVLTAIALAMVYIRP